MPPNYIDRSSPIKVPWSADEVITDGGYHTFIRKNDKWYGMGANHYGQLGLGSHITENEIYTPIELSLKGIDKIVTDTNMTFARIKDKWYVCGSNSNCLLGLGKDYVNISVIREFTSVNWKTHISPKKLYRDNGTMTILSDDGIWYELGLNNDEMHGLCRKLKRKNKKYCPKYIFTPIKSRCQKKSEEELNEEYRIPKLCTKCNFGICHYGDYDVTFCNYCKEQDGELFWYDQEKKDYEKYISNSDFHKFLVDKFSSLQKYFKGIESVDLLSMNMEDLIDYVYPEDKILMKLFIKKHLSLESNQYNDISNINNVKIFSLEPDDSGLVNLSHMIHNSSSIYHNPISLSYLQKTLKERVHDIKILDLSNNWIGDNNLSIVKDIVKLLQPNLRVLKLCSNNIGYFSEICNKVILELLEMKNIEYIDISNNSILSSINTSEICKELTLNHFKKLIFIPKSWMHNSNWKFIVTNNKFHETIINAHNNYYSQYFDPIES